MNRFQATSLVLRLSIAFAFIYAAIAASFRPDDWIGYFPSLLRDMFSNAFLLHGWGLFEILLSVWLISGKRVFIPSVIAGLSLLGLVVTNLGALDVTFRDVSLAGACLALAVLHFPRHDDHPRFS